MSSTMDRLRRYVAREKLKSVGVRQGVNKLWTKILSSSLINILSLMQIVWAGGLGITLAYQWSKPIPLQMKIIHSRVTAQVGFFYFNSAFLVIINSILH